MSVQSLANSKDLDCNNISINQTSHSNRFACNELLGGSASVVDMSATNVTPDTLYANTIVERDGINVPLGNSILGNGNSGIINPMTSIGDLIVGGSFGNPTRLGIGGNKTVLTVNDAGTGVVWSLIPNPLEGRIFISYATNAEGNMESKSNVLLPVRPSNVSFELIGSTPSNGWNPNYSTGQVTIPVTGVYKFTFTVNGFAPPTVPADNEFQFTWSVNDELQTDSTLKYVTTGGKTFLTGIYFKQVNAGIPVKLVQTQTSNVDTSTETGFVFITIEFVNS